MYLSLFGSCLILMAKTWASLYRTNATSNQRNLTWSVLGRSRNLRRLKQIILDENSGSPPPNRIPLQECEGDCDNDDEVRDEWRRELCILCFPLS